MEKTLATQSFKKGHLRVTFLRKQFLIGFVGHERNFTYICLGPFVFEWHSINKF
jgi:hypothetical protein